MFDDLRESARESYEDELTLLKETPPKAIKKPSSRFLGLSAPQRFVLVTILFFMTCLVGSLCLLVTEKVYLPVFW